MEELCDFLHGRHCCGSLEDLIQPIEIENKVSVKPLIYEVIYPNHVPIPGF